MVSLGDLSLAIQTIQAVLTFIEKVDPNAANNPLVIDLQKALDILKGFGL